MRLRKCAVRQSAKKLQYRWLKYTFLLIKRLNIHNNGFNGVTAALNGMLHVICISFTNVRLLGRQNRRNSSACISLLGVGLRHCLRHVGRKLCLDSRSTKPQKHCLRKSEEWRPARENPRSRSERYNGTAPHGVSTFKFDKLLRLTIVEIVRVQCVNLLIIEELGECFIIIRSYKL